MTGIPLPQSATRRLVGRGRELETLAQLLDDAGKGQGKLAVVSGEAGIGKTSLIRTLGELGNCYQGHCYEFTTTAPYGPWLEILDALHGRGSPHSTADKDEQGPLDRHKVLSRLLHYIRELNAGKPVALVLEDMHWSDAASVELLQIVARTLPDLPVLLVISYRHDDVGSDHPLRRLLPHLLRDTGAARIRLQRLSLEDTATVVTSRYGLTGQDGDRLAAYLFSLAHGNPFFSIELLYELENRGVLTQQDQHWLLHDLKAQSEHLALPDLVQQVIESRLDRVDPSTRRLLECASIVGQEVPIHIWRHVAGADQQEFLAGVAEAIAHHFITETRDGRAIAFSHAIVREVIYHGVILPDRQQLHREAAEVHMAGESQDVERIAHHLSLAMDPRAVEWLATAGSRALQLGAPLAAIVHCSRALDLARDLSIPVPSGVYRTRGNARSQVGEFSRAHQDLTMFLNKAQIAPDPMLQWQALQDLGQLWESRDYSKTRDYFSEALSLARQIGNEETIAHSLNRIGNWYLNDARPEHAVEFHQAALETFRARGDRRAMAQTLDLLGMDYVILGDHASAGACLTDAIATFEALGDTLSLCSAMSSYILTLGTLGFDLERPCSEPSIPAQDAIDRALRMATRSHWRAGEASIHCIAGGYFAIRGQMGHAMDHLQAGLDIAIDIEHKEWESYALDNLADVHLKLLDQQGSQQFSERALAAGHLSGSKIHLHAARSTLAANLLQRNDIDRALEIMGMQLDSKPRLRSADGRLNGFWFAQALLQSGKSEAALGLLDNIATSYPGGRSTPASPMYARLHGDVLAALSRFQEAEHVYLAGISAASEMGYLPVLWQLWLRLGTLNKTMHRDLEARRCHDQARSTVTAIAQTVPDTQMRTGFLNAALQQIPGAAQLTPFQTVKLQSGGLTPRQRDVTVLVAQGMTNAAIARELNLSERTVEGHVSAILTTLNLSSRAHIAAWAVSHQITSG